MPMTAAQFNKSLWPGIKTLFGLEYKRYPEEYKEIFEIGNSDKAFEEDVRITGFGEAVTTGAGAPVTYDTAQESYTSRYVHQTVMLGFALTKEAEEDNQYGSLMQRYTKAIVRSMAHTKELRGANVLNNAFSASYLGGDGKRLCATDHPLVNGGSQSNRPTTGVDFDESGVEAALIQIAGWTDDRGLPIAALGVKAILPRQYHFVAERLFKTVLRTGTADNDINAIKSMGALPQGYTINHRLTDTDAWFIKTDVPDGLKHYVRVKPTFDKEGDFDTANLKFKGRERYSFGWSDPLGIWGSPGLT